MRDKFTQLLFSEDKTNLRLALIMAKEEPCKSYLKELALELLEFHLFSANEQQIDLAFDLGKEQPFKGHFEEFLLSFSEDLECGHVTYDQWLISHDDAPKKVYKKLLQSDYLPEGEGYDDLCPHMRQTREIIMEFSRLEVLPAWLGKFKNLSIVKATDSEELTSIAPEFFNAVNLKKFIITHAPLESISSDIKKLKHLEHLELSCCEFTTIPEEIGTLKNLSYLNLCGFQGETIPSSIGNLKKLKYLELRETVITEIPKEVFTLTALEEIKLTDVPITHLPEEIGDLKNLKTLDLMYTNLKTLPERLWELEQLSFLDLYCVKIGKLSPKIGNLKNLKELSIIKTGINELPEEFLNLKKLNKLEINGECLVNNLKLILKLSSLKHLRLFVPKETTILNFDDSLEAFKERNSKCKVKISNF